MGRRASVKGVGTATYHQIAIGRLDRLSDALGLDAHLGRFRALVSWLFRGWGDAAVPDSAPYPSALTNDHSPFEYSLSFAGMGVDLSLRIEAQAANPTLVENREAALAFNERLLPFGVDFDRFQRVRELFLPATFEPPFSLWHELTLRPGAVASFKLYLNPAAAGPDRAPGLVKEALARLGHKNVDPTLDRLLRRGAGLDEVAWVSLDLSSGPGAETRVYVRHLAATAADLERTLSFFPAHRAGDAIGACRAVVRGAGAFAQDPPMTSVAFGHGGMAPAAAGLDVVIGAERGPDDGETSRQLAVYLASLGLDSNAYARALASFAPRALPGKAGIQSRVSFIREVEGPRATVHLCPEVFRTGAVGASQTRLKGDAAEPLPDTRRGGKKAG
jgi:hypothetical protein